MTVKTIKQLEDEGLDIQPMQWIMLEPMFPSRLCGRPLQFTRQSGSRVYYREWDDRENEFGAERFAQMRSVRYVADTLAEAEEFYKSSRDREDALMYAEQCTKFEWGQRAQNRFGIPNQFTEPKKETK